ncbi:hypothetical protein [Myroides pelagicus]|uniref:Endonuclease n=1 Tax=Myroides pelagicus TaxID=270914 RepID=A0A7K1GPN9_9FLAO|nr:hypothetical protein [Myroides pelagicus]MTH30816.1 hypothetical protein [Myroides pelagicus]
MNNISTYLIIKKEIFDILRQMKYSELSQKHIKDEVLRVQRVIEKISFELYRELKKIVSNDKLNEKDWLRMVQELEDDLKVNQSPGILLQDNQNNRVNRQWWSNTAKSENELFYWNRYREEISDKLPLEVVQRMDEDTDIIMDSIENPLIDTFNIRGLVVGHVQSGKTGNYTGLLCKAADAGYKFIIVITGGMNNLRNQTQIRINEGFVGRTDNNLVGVGLRGYEQNKSPYSLTLADRDFNINDKDNAIQSISFETISVPVVMVIKKNYRTLEHVISWIKARYKKVVTELDLVT